MIDFKVDESLCVSCGACVKDCLHQALRMDTYPVMVDEGHCIRCQHCLAVCPTGAVSIMGAAASDCTPLAGNIPEPRQLDTLFKGRRSVRHYKRENVSPGLLQELLDSAAYAPTGSNAQNLLVSVVDIAAMDALREAVYLRLDELAETGAMPDCQRRAFFLSAGKLWKAGGWDGIFRSALRDRGQREECDLRRAGPAHLSVVLRADGTGARDRHALVRPAVLVPAGRAA